MRFARRLSTPSHSIFAEVRDISGDLPLGQCSSKPVRLLYIHRRPSCRRQTLPQTIPPSIEGPRNDDPPHVPDASPCGARIRMRRSSKSPSPFVSMFKPRKRGRRAEYVRAAGRLGAPAGKQFPATHRRSDVRSRNKSPLLRLMRVVGVKTGTKQIVATGDELRFSAFAAIASMTLSLPNQPRSSAKLASCTLQKCQTLICAGPSSSLCRLDGAAAANGGAPWPRVRFLGPSRGCTTIGTSLAADKRTRLLRLISVESAKYGARTVQGMQVPPTDPSII